MENENTNANVELIVTENEPANEPFLATNAPAPEAMAPESESESKMLINLIQTMINNTKLKDKYAFVIDEKQQAFLQRVLSLSPNLFADIENVIKEIIKDGKINADDIPQMITLVKKIYQVIYEIKNEKMTTLQIADITCKILKFVIYILVEERKINVDQAKEEEFFKYIDILLVSCVGLLSFPKTIKTKGCWKAFLGCFSCK